MKIIISPYSSKLKTGARNPKDYPYWSEFVELLHREFQCVVMQIGVNGEQRIPGMDGFQVDLPFARLRQLIEECDAWLSVDNFLPHFCHYHQLKCGIVLWGPSDPVIFGYSQNINLLRDRKYLRPWQYQDWESWQHDPEAFVSPNEVVAAVGQVVSRELVYV